MSYRVLTIAGSDPSGGAGIQADLKTFTLLGVDGCAVITALTAQNDRAVFGVMPVAGHFVAAQLAAVFEDADIHAVKIGMLGHLGPLRAVVDALRTRRIAQVVVDPVLRSSSGTPLLEAAAVDALRRDLLPMATVVTPNAAEAGVLLGTRAPATLDEMHTAARRIHALGPRWVLVTGGHVDTGGECVDVLCDGATVRDLRTPRVASEPLHGSGCRLSSAIAAGLATGKTVPDACAAAQQYVARAIAAPRHALQEADV